MSIVLTTEEYFDNDVCMNCYTVIDFPITFYLPEDQVLTLCEHCSFGMYQCSICRNTVSHLDDTPHREMVYTGPDGTFDDLFIRCRDCVNQNQVVYDDDETDTEEEVETCDIEEQTQLIC